MRTRTAQVVIPPRLWTAKEAGNKWETELERYHADYNRLGLACIFRTPPEVRFVRGAMIRVADGPPDYCGVADHLALLLEAKTHSQPRFQLDMIALHQAVRMDAWDKQDRRNIAAILMFDREHDVRFVLPWEDLRDRWWRWAHGEAKHGEASLTIEQVERIGRRFDQTTGGWLRPLQDWAKRRVIDPS